VPDIASGVDVTVIGGGLAGMAASVHLARAGLDVLCVGPDMSNSPPVGESLDWSAPELLAALGLPMDRLIAEGVATYKRHVTLKLDDGVTQHYVPSEWLGQPPFNVELRTLHVDRSKLNDAIRQIALNHGVKLLHSRVTNIDRDGKRVLAINTLEGARISSPWFIDASGSSASIFPRAFNLPFHEYGPRKTAMWTYFTVSESIEGTTLYAEASNPPYMEWMWEIPIQANTISVGYVAPGDSIKAQRQQGLSVEDIFRTQLSRFPRFAEVLQSSNVLSPHVTSFRCRVHGKVAGPNWLVAGEAASMVDPMTSNGVTAALRHAAEASSLVIRYRYRRQIPFLAAAMYSRRVAGMARFFNCGIEKVVYDWPIRNCIGVATAGDVYTAPAWTLNAIYARLHPRGLLSTMFFDGVLCLFRAVASVFYSFCRQEESAFRVSGVNDAEA
jgi:menaquinone-9 beta-reductase